MISKIFKSLFSPYFSFFKRSQNSYFVDRRGRVVTFDLNDPNLQAWNYTITGQTGAGKSVLANAIQLSMMEERRIDPLQAQGRGNRPPPPTHLNVLREGNNEPFVMLDVGGDRGSYLRFMELINSHRVNAPEDET